MVITLAGANDFALDAELHKLTTAFIAAHGDMALERLDGEEAGFERLQEALTSLPFLADAKLVFIKQGSANKQFTEAAPELLADLPQTTTAILVEPKLDKRLAYYKFLKKDSDFREFPELDASGLARWLVQEAVAKNGTLKPADAQFLVSRVGASQQLLASELEKLLLYAPEITRENIEKLTDATPQSTVFDLLDAAFSGNTKKALALYAEQRQLKVEPQQIIAMLTWQLHTLAIIKTAGDRSPQTIADEAKISPYTVTKSLRIAQKITLTQLKMLVRSLLEIDTRAKRETFNIDDALKHYLLTISS